MCISHIRRWGSRDQRTRAGTGLLIIDTLVRSILSVSSWRLFFIIPIEWHTIHPTPHNDYRSPVVNDWFALLGSNTELSRSTKAPRPWVEQGTAEHISHSGTIWWRIVQDLNLSSSQSNVNELLRKWTQSLRPFYWTTQTSYHWCRWWGSNPHDVSIKGFLTHLTDWSRPWDLNSYTSRYWYLKPARLPIPPRRV